MQGNIRFVDLTLNRSADVKLFLIEEVTIMFLVLVYFMQYAMNLYIYSSTDIINLTCYSFKLIPQILELVKLHNENHIEIVYN